MAAGAWPPLFERPAVPNSNAQQAASTDSDEAAAAAAKQQRQQRSSRLPRRGGSPKPGCSKCAAAHEQAQPLAARSPVALGMVVATSAYCAVKAGIQGYQHLRRRNLRHLVRHVAPVLDGLGVQYWADFGTLLGMYREKDIILHDNDADLVVLNPDWEALLEALRARLPGFRVFFVVPSEDRSIRWIRVMSGVGIMDLYGAFLEPPPAGDGPGGAVAKASAAAGTAPGAGNVAIPQGHGDLCDVPGRLVFPLGVMKFRGTPVSVPGDVPGVLRFRYGDTFMIPRYMDKGRDCVEQGKLYARLLGALGRAGLRV